MKRTLFLCISGIVGSLSLLGQIHLGILKENSSDWYPLTEIREICFSDSQLAVITSTSENPYSYSDIFGMNFGMPDNSGIAITKEENKTLTLTGNLISGEPTSEIILYDMMGRKISSFKGSGDISYLKSGIYVAVSNGTSLKFMKK